MDTKHTPGPWMTTMSGRTKDGGAHQHQIGTLEKTVAYAWVPITGDKDQMFHEHNANARLIAAAPELLAALEDIIDDIKKGRTEWETNGTLKYANNAILKARGQS